MAMPRGHTPPPRPYVTSASSATPADPVDPVADPTSAPPLPPVHGEHDAYGPHAYGGRARRTIPMDYQPLVDEDIELPIRGRCGACHGSGVVSGRETRCVVCRRRYSYETIVRAPRFGFMGRRVQFPCGHEAIQGKILWVRPRCELCEGEGFLYRYIRWGDFITALYGDEESAGELDDETTAALRALGRAAQSDHHAQHAQHAHTERSERWARSGEPTAPAPHLATGGPAPYYHTPHASHTSQERVTPQVGPHLAPLAPDAPSPPQPPDDMPSRF